MKNNWLKLIIAIIICEAAGGIGSIFTANSVAIWFPTLNKPSFNPPNWLFAPVWTLLFLLMGIALYLVWQKKSNQWVKTAVMIFAFQLILNIAWSFLFFFLHNPLAGLIEIIFLWLAILLTIIYFYKISKPAAYLLLPYLLWVSFAAVLTYFLFRLN